MKYEDVGWYWRQYQLDFFNDPSQLIAIVKSRQIGMSEALALYPVIQAIKTPHINTFLVSTNFKKAKDLLQKVKKWAKATLLLDPSLAGYLTITKDTADEVVFASGNRVRALPCKPLSVRGETGTIILDEVDHYVDPWEIYTAIAPSISSDKTGTMKLIASSTPLGEQRFLYRVFNDAEFGKDFSKHNIDVYRAVQEGHNPKVLKLRSQYSEEAWAQEFECAFIGDGSKYFSYDLLALCSSLEPLKKGDLYIGIDIGRTSDRTAIVVLRSDKKTFSVESVQLLDKGMPHDKQLVEINKIIDRVKPRRVAIDARGEGSGTYDHLKSRHGSKISGFKATNQIYLDIIPRLKASMESKLFYLPNDSNLHSAFGKIQKEQSSDSIRFKANRTQDGHADLFYATLIAFQEAYEPPKAKTPPASGHSVQTQAMSRLKGY